MSPLAPSPSPVTLPSLLLYLSVLQISHFKIPRYIVFVSDYPLTVSGKVCEVEVAREGILGLQVAQPMPLSVASRRGSIGGLTYHLILMSPRLSQS